MCFDPGKMTVPIGNRSLALGTCRLAQSLFLAFSLITSERLHDGAAANLARHQGFRRLVANGVKCMSNYSELSTYHEYGNIFSDVVYSFCVPRARSQNFETITGNKLPAREKCRLINAKKNSNHRYFEMLFGVHTCWLEPLVALLRYQMFLIFVSHVSCHFSWIIPKISFYFFIDNVR